MVIDTGKICDYFLKVIPGYGQHTLVDALYIIFFGFLVGTLLVFSLHFIRNIFFN